MRVYQQDDKTWLFTGVSESEVREATKQALAPLWDLAPLGSEDFSQSATYSAFKRFCTENFSAADSGLIELSRSTKTR